MTSRARISGVLLATTALLAMTACSSDSNDAAPTTAPVTVPGPTVAPTTIPLPLGDIVAVALTNGVFTQLAGLVAEAGLIETLRSPGPFTVFAPTDDAFKKLPLDTLHAVQDDAKLLATVLTYHVVPGALTMDDLKAAAAGTGKLATAAGIDLTVTVEGDNILIDGKAIAAGPVPATNGNVYVMGDVLVPAAG